MPRVFARLSLWIDPAPRDGPAHMACDEALMGCAAEPVLRVFHWERPWVSSGYFVPWKEVQRARPDLPSCRRWTGGGVVVHENDFTFALVAPRTEPWARLRPEESYRVLHEAVAEALRTAGCDAALFHGPATGAVECFAGPVLHDVLSGTRKIAGGAQRRTKRGLLHQGSIQAGIGPEFSTVLAAALTGETTGWIPPEGFEERVTCLTRDKYAREGFLRRETL